MRPTWPRTPGPTRSGRGWRRSAWAAWTSNQTTTSCWRRVRSSTTRCTHGAAAMRTLPPTLREPLDADLRSAVADACGLAVDDLVQDLPVQVVSTGLPHMEVPVRTVDALVGARSRPERLGPLLEGAGTDG